MLLRSARLSFGIKSSITSSSAGRFLSTIYALSSGHGKCGVSVIRVSGPNSAKAITSLTGRLKPPEARRATFTKIYDPETGIVLDHSLAIWFPGPASFTGEDICEFQVHGSPAVVRAVLKALAKVPGLRAAEIGEFTRRAFSAGKLDLTQVEGLCDLIHSETEQQRKQALRQMEGGLSKQFEVWRNQLVKIVANVEAFIDFAESEEIEEDILQQVRESVSKLDVEFTRHLAAAEAGERLREGVHLAIVGEPNVGKSSLLNYLVQRDAAIVSHIPGTTRDVIETRLDLAGYPVNICDTAGLREDTSDPVEKEGMTRALLHAKQADLVLRVQDVTTHETKGLSNEIIIESERTLNIVNKIDLLDDPGSLEMRPDHIYISVKTGAGLEELTSKLIAEIELLCQTNSIGECPSITRQRHREHLKRASIHLQEYLTQESNGNDIVIVAQQLRKAIREIGFVTGKISSEKILDVIFSDFCIGK